MDAPAAASIEWVTMTTRTRFGFGANFVQPTTVKMSERYGHCNGTCGLGQIFHKKLAGKTSKTVSATRLPDALGRVVGHNRKLR